MIGISSVNRRILALWLPTLPVDRLQRRAKRKESVTPDELPLVVISKQENALRLSAVDARAARLGLFPGLALTDARARVPALNVAEADEMADAALLETIANWCDRFTPLVALDPPFGIFLEITGCSHLFCGEQTMAEEIFVRLTSQGFNPQVAIAGTAVAARALARYAPGTIAAAGREAGAVSELPVAALCIDHKTTTALKRAGLKTIADVATRARAELSARFGAAFVFLLEQIQGYADSPISPRRPIPDYIAEQCFAEPVATSDVIENIILSLAGKLEGILERHGQGARLLEAAFFRADGSVRRISVETGRPLKDAATLARLFHERLDALTDPIDPGFGFDLVRISVNRVEPLIPEPINFHAESHEIDEVSALVDRLSARFGAERVLRFHAQNTHIPERAGLAFIAQRQMPSNGWTELRETGEAPRRPVRMLARPEPIEVIAEVPEGPPARFIWRRAAHAVIRAEGPERIAMEWWQTSVSQPTRDYFQIEDKNGGRFWIYRDGLYLRETDSPVWYMHGLFA